MICTACQQNKATVFLTQMVEGKVKKVDLCESCSKEKGIDDPTGFSLADLLLGLGASQELEKSGDSVAPDLKCPRCGFDKAEFKKTGRLGCAECYEIFNDGLNSLLKAMHKGTRHVGKVPKALKRSREYQLKLSELEVGLKKAVDEERFEQAAQFRDQIQRMKSDFQSSPAH